MRTGLIQPRFMSRSHVCQSAMQCRENKIVYSPTITKTHFMLGGMHIHINLCRVQFQIEYKRGVATVVEHVSIGLLHRMSDQPVANNAAVHKKVL